MKRDPALRSAVLGVAGTALALAVVALPTFGPWAAFGVAVGGCLATANLVLFQRIVAAFLEQKGNAATWAVIGALKLIGLFAVAYVVLNTGLFSAFAFAIGYAALPIGITLSTLFRKTPEDEPAEPGALPPSGGTGSEGEGAGGDVAPRADVVNGPRTE